MNQTIAHLIRSVRDEDFKPLAAIPRLDPREEGYVCALISSELTGSEDLRVTVGRFLPGQYHLKHHHPSFAEFYFILKGEITLDLAGHESILTAGTSVYVPKHFVHALRNHSNDVCDLLSGFPVPDSEGGLVYDE